MNRAHIVALLIVVLIGIALETLAHYTLAAWFIAAFVVGFLSEQLADAIHRRIRAARRP